MLRFLMQVIRPQGHNTNTGGDMAAKKKVAKTVKKAKKATKRTTKKK